MRDYFCQNIVGSHCTYFKFKLWMMQRDLGCDLRGKMRKLQVKHRYRRSHVKNGVKKEVSKSPSRALPEAGASGPLRL